MEKIKKLVKLVPSSAIFTGSMVIFAGTLITGLGNYLYNFFMGRMLGPDDFGVLASLVALIYIISVPSNTINLVTSKFVTRLKSQGRGGDIRGFVIKANKKAFLLGLCLGLIFIIISPLIKNFFHLTSIWPVFCLGIIFLISFLLPVNLGALRGLKKFSRITFNSILLTIFKIGVAVTLVGAGLGVVGALIAVAIARLIGAVNAFFSIKTTGSNSAGVKFEKELWYFAAPAFFSLLFLTVLYNVDVVMVKHFFDPTQAGYYAVLSTLGKVIFFVSGSIGMVIFPLSSERRERGSSTRGIIMLSLCFVLISSVIISAGYFFLPDLCVKIFFGENYLPVAPFLGYVGIVFTMYSLIYTISIYFLSLERKGFIWILLAGVILEVGLISFFHEGIKQVVIALFVVMFLVLGGLFCLSQIKLNRSKFG